SYRQIVNLADVNDSLSAHAPGQSGHPIDKHYGDFIPMWLRVGHHPMLYGRNDIEASKPQTLQLVPEA
ncbi:MAG TPA: hypothetical protein DHW02_02495, partial [Ktedonobacter sp.]|nr:hypothetical protein [Ktedonobacter sp.]